MSTEEGTTTAPPPAPDSPPKTTTTTTNDKPPSSAAPPKSEKDQSGGSKEGSKPRSQRAAAAVANSKSASSPVKTIARPGKARSSMPNTSKKSAGGGDKTFKVGDIVLARLKGYPAWPARIANPDDLPQKVAVSRPSKNPNIYCCQFFPVGDYAWLNNKDISTLSPSDIQAYLSQTHRKQTGGLAEAYQTAQDPTEWDEAQAENRKQQEEEANANDEEDELDEDEGEAAGASGKKRKAPASKGGKKKTKVEKEKAPKSEKAAPKSKNAATKKETDSKPAPVENQAPADEDPLSNDPGCVKVKDWRHKLQRAFLGKGVPGADEMGTYDDLFKTIENYKEMSIDALTYSKIGKVMKKIAHMDNIPRNDELRITDRAQKLMVDWQQFIDGKTSKENGANGDHKEEPSNAAANGEAETTA